MRVANDETVHDVSPTKRFTCPLWGELPTFQFVEGNIYALRGGNAFDLWYNDGIYNHKLTYGSLGTNQNLASVLTTGNVSDGYDIVMTGTSSIVMPTLPTTATEGFVRLSHVQGIPTGDTGYKGDLAFNALSNMVYVHTGAGTWSPMFSGHCVWEAITVDSTNVIRTHLADVPDATSRVMLFGTQDTQGPGRRFMFDPQTAAFWGGNATVIFWNAFGLNETANTMLYGRDNSVELTGVYSVSNSVILGGEFNTLFNQWIDSTNSVITGYANSLSSKRSAIMGGTFCQIIDVCADCVVLASENVQLHGKNLLAPFAGSEIRRCGAMGCDDFELTINAQTIVDTCENCGEYSGTGNKMQFQGTANGQNAFMACSLCRINTTNLFTAYQDSMLATVSGIINVQTNTSNVSLISCNTVNVQTPANVTNSAFISVNANTLTNNMSNSVAIGLSSTNLIGNTADTVHVPNLRTHGEISIQTSGLTPTNGIGTVTLDGFGQSGSIPAHLGPDDHIYLEYVSASPLTNPGAIWVSSRTNGAPGSFQIQSSSASDSSVVGYTIVTEL